MKKIKAKVDNCNTFSFQCKKIRITLTRCPFLENGIDRCSIENKGIDNIYKLPKWCPLEDYKEADHENPN